MTPVREKALRGRDVADEAGLEVPRGSRQVESPDESCEVGNRRAGVLLIVIGCGLMALAAGEAFAETSPVSDRPAAPAPVTLAP